MKKILSIIALFVAVVVGSICFCSLIDQVKFKQSFGFSFPKTTAERDAMRPLVIKRLNEYIATVTNCQVEAAALRKKAEALPFTGPEDANRRITAFNECERIEKRLAELEERMYSAAVALEGVGWSDIAKSAGIQPRGGGPFD